jgi:hypothetical protein
MKKDIEETMVQPGHTIEFPEVGCGFTLEITKPVTQEFVDVLTDEIRNGESRRRLDSIFERSNLDLKEFSELLSKVLRHRLIPNRLYNAIVDELARTSEEHSTTPEYIQQSIVETYKDLEGAFH